MNLANIPLRGRVFFGTSLLLGFDVDNISIVETYKGLQSIHLNGLHQTEGWKDELAREYSGLLAEADGVKTLSNHDWKNKALLIQVLDLQTKVEGKDEWTPLSNTLKFFGELTSFGNSHMTFKPTRDPATGLGAAVTQYIAAKMSEESILRKILPPKVLGE